MDAHVAVIGVGTMGSMALWQLARRGIDAIGFERFGLGHDRSAAGGESRIFRTIYLEGPQYIPMLRRALDLWRELEAESGRQLLTLNGGLTIGTADSEKMRNALASIAHYSLPHEVLDRPTVAERYPQHRLLPGETAIWDPAAGVLRPEYAVLAAAHQARDLGATILENTTVTRVEPDTDSVAVHTADHTYRVRQAIVTAGPWTTRLAPALAGHITPRRLVSTWYAAADPDAFEPDRFPIVIRSTDAMRFYAFPALDGRSVKVGGSPSITDLADPDDLDRNLHPRELAAINEAVARFLPGLTPQPIRISAYMDGYTTDGHPIINSPDPRMLVLGRFSGHGFKIAPAIGHIAADLIHHGHTNVPIDHLLAAGR